MPEADTAEKQPEKQPEDQVDSEAENDSRTFLGLVWQNVYGLSIFLF